MPAIARMARSYSSHARTGRGTVPSPRLIVAPLSPEISYRFRYQRPANRRLHGSFPASSDQPSIV
ncbi:hypothetical protein ACLUTX_07085 [Enterobacterales bacterium AE_CKDN230030158-1A_HGKHYDSX7]